MTAKLGANWIQRAAFVAEEGPSQSFVHDPAL
jgi:hypothetical protein